MRFPDRYSSIARYAIALLLLVAGIAKVSSAMTDAAGGVPCALGLCELFVGILMVCNRWVVVALIFASGIAIGGVVQSLVTRAPCNCFGYSYTFGWRAHLLLSCGLGLLVAISSRSVLFQRMADPDPSKQQC